MHSFHKYHSAKGNIGFLKVGQENDPIVTTVSLEWHLWIAPMKGWVPGEKPQLGTWTWKLPKFAKISASESVFTNHQIALDAHKPSSLTGCNTHIATTLSLWMWLCQNKLFSCIWNSDKAISQKRVPSEDQKAMVLFSDLFLKKHTHTHNSHSSGRLRLKSPRKSKQKCHK